AAPGQPAGLSPATPGQPAGLSPATPSQPAGLSLASQTAATPAPGQRPPRRDIVLLGSTGSIGTQAADIVRRNPGRFRITGLAAGGSNPALLASQALEF